MKKRMFRMLCVVLALALLAPNVFAATSAPEVPLADEATVTRVKNEIAQGEITDMEDLFLVAYQHLGADLEEEGMTAYINEDGTLGFTQILNTNQTRSGSTEQELAVTSIAFLNADGTRSTVRIDSITGYGSGSISGLPVYATHTAYIWRETSTGPDLIDEEFKFKLNYAVTTINYDTSLFVPTKLVHEYEGIQYYSESADDIYETGIDEIDNPSNGSHSFTPGSRSWLRSGSGITGWIKTTATIYVSNTGNTIELSVTYSLADRAFQ